MGFRPFTIGLLALLSIGAAPAKAPVETAPTGRMNLVFSERSALSYPEALAQRLGPYAFVDIAHATPTEAARNEYDVTRESFDVVVPQGYRPDVPHGLFVWVGVTEYSPEWLEVLAKHRIIFITANNTGGRMLAVKEGLALDGVHNMIQRYNIDRQRIFVSGFSAGGQLATYMLRRYPDVFSGGLLLMGGYFYASYEVAPKGRRDPTAICAEPYWHGQVEQLKKFVKIVMLKGGRVVASGAPSDVLTAENIQEVFGVEVVLDRNPASGNVRVTNIF